MKAYVKTPLTVSPAYVTLYSTGNEIITREVEITAELPRPLTLTPIQFSLGGTLTYRIDEIEKGKRFKISLGISQARSATSAVFSNCKPTIRKNLRWQCLFQSGMWALKRAHKEEGRNWTLVLSSHLIPRIDRPWKTAIKQTVVLSLIAIVIGLIVNQLRSDSIPLLGDWSPGARITLKFGKNILIPFEEAKDKFLTGSAVFLDARTPELYQEGHIQGARNVPIAEFDKLADKVFMEFPEDTLFVTYCDGEDCALSAELALKLKEIGYENVRVLHNGWSVWKSHQLPFQGVKEQEG